MTETPPPHVKIVRRRAAEAATAIERLTDDYALGNTGDPITVAYIERILTSVARLRNFADDDLTHTEADPKLRTRKTAP